MVDDESFWIKDEGMMSTIDHSLHCVKNYKPCTQMLYNNHSRL